MHDVEQIRLAMHELRRQIAVNPNDIVAIAALAGYHMSLGENVKALRAYEKVTLSATENVQVRWSAFVNVGMLRAELGYYPISDSLEAFNAAFHLVPYRVEPLYHAAKLCRERGSHPMAFIYATAALGIESPDEMAIVDPDMYIWKIPLEYAWAAANMGMERNAKEALVDVLRSSAPDDIKEEARQEIAKILSNGKKLGG